MIAELGPSCSTEEMFDQLVAEYQMPLKRMSFIYLHDMALAEDAVQETFLKVYKPGNIRGTGITKNFEEDVIALFRCVLF